MFDSENLPIYYGRNGSLALFFSEDKGVILDTDVNLVVQTGELDSLSNSKNWDQAQEEFSAATLDLASGALFDLNLKVITADAGRMYTIPKGAQAEAKKALEWHAENHRGGTPVGLNTARILSRGGQIGLHKVRHIAKYFPRHEVDKKGKGWKPGEDGFPSNGRIAWALWGGDVAWRWAKAIVERENKAITADGYLDLDSIIPIDTYDADIASFEKSLLLDPSAAPEFIARVRLDGSGIDRLYKIDISGEVYLWDGGNWDDLGNVENNVWSYDEALDDPYDLVEKAHITVDADAAIIISAHLQENPFSNISIEDIDQTEAILAAEALAELDISEMDSVITAAGSAHEIAHQLAPQNLRQVRAVNAEKELRGPGGKFAPGGSTKARLTSGPLGLGNPESTNWTQSLSKPLDLSGILATPRAPEDEPYAHLKGDLPAMTTGDLHGILAEWNSWVQSQRGQTGVGDSTTGPKSAMKPTNSPDTSVAASAAEFGDVTSETPAEPSEAPEDDDEQIEEQHERDFHPLIANWIKHKNRKKVKDLSKDWANPVIAAIPAPSDVTPVQQKSDDGVPAKISPDKGSKVHPDNSDVQPLYMAIVDADDPEAVANLIAIVPESSSSPSPMVYRRDHGMWIPDQKIMNDLKSATPPPVVPLDSKELNSVLLQVDESSPPKKSRKPAAVMAASIGLDPSHILTVLWGKTSVTAGGGLDRNRGNAENLRHYWTYGPGAAKIRWGEGGDWSRCVRHLAKYLGVRAKGYCQLRHKEATGMYTATHAKLDRKAHEHSASEFIMEEVYTGNPGVPTSVHEKDMAKSLGEIMNQHDDIYDHHWEPHPEIKNQLKDLNKMTDEEFEAYCGADENTYFSSEHSDDDPCWDGYRQIGFKDKNGRHVPNCVKETSMIVAAGGLDRNRGAAEKLRHYWTVGRGGVKIGWNTGGDWTRCVRHLEKYLGPRAKGYCALRHKEMTGMWTGDKMHRQIYGRKRGGQNVFSTDVIKSSQDILDDAVLNAKLKDAKERIAIVAGGLKAPALTEQGAKFSIPLVVPEETESGDGRKFSKGALSIRDLPLPLMWQMKTAQGHDGSVVVGRIDSMERIANGLGNAYGVFDNGAHAKEVQRLIRNGFIRGVSVDLDKFEAQEMPSEAAEGEPEAIGKSKLSINKARVMGVTIVPKPAFQECKILIDDEPNTTYPQEDGMITDGIYVDDADASDAQALVACGIIAGAIPVVPPTDWFQNPKLTGPTPLTIDDNGRVFGHIAAWHVDHIGLSFGTKPPRSKSNYAYFHTGVVRTDSGKDIPVGQLTLAGGHASLEASASEAVKHYDDTASAIADVHAGEDQFGIWVAGSLRPNAAPEQIRALRASAPSGDWRPIRGSLELVAVCQVNVPGFPIARARVASGAVMALVAAGASTLAKLKADPMAELNARIERLENLRFVNNGSTKSTPSKAELAAQIAELSARVREGELAYISRDEREGLAKKGEAMPDGSYPIRNVEDLRAAIHAYGRAKHPELVKKHIIKRANELDFRHLIPESWKEASEYADKSDLRSRIAAFTAKQVTTSPGNLRARVAAATEALGKAPATEDKKVPQSLTEKSPTETVKKELYKDLPISMQHFIKKVVRDAEESLSPEHSEEILKPLTTYVMGKSLLTPPEVAKCIENVMKAIA